MASSKPASPDPTKATSGTPVPGEDDDSNEEQTDQPLPMTASVVLSALPKTASEALQGAGDLIEAKVTIRFQPVGSAPSLKQRVYKISSHHRFSFVVSMLRKRLGVQSKDSVFCYINSIFSPGLDEGVGNLWRCFKTGPRQELVINYAMTPAFG